MPMSTSGISKIASGRSFDAVLSVSQLLICIVCYAMLILLYCRPESYHIKTLLLADSEHWWDIKPTVAVPFFTTILLAVTSSLITRSVENSLWAKLSPHRTGRHLTVGETRHLAEWIVSPWGRLKYSLTGASFLLRISGLVLFASSIVSSILGFGIGTKTSRQITTQHFSAGPNISDGFYDLSLQNLNSGRDNLHVAAALASMTNLSVPASSLCPSSNSTFSCGLTARAHAIIANCNSNSLPNTGNDGSYDISDPHNTTSCSMYNDQVCVSLVSADVWTLANFTSGQTEFCEINPLALNCSGQWAIIYGTWVDNVGRENVTDIGSLNTVDCVLSYGNITIIQNGSTSPTLSRTSFSENTVVTDPGPLQRVYTVNTETSPYTFAGFAGGDGFNTLLYDPIGTFLLDYTLYNDTNSTASAVARRIENNFDAATLSAFVRAPAAADITIVTTTGRQVWSYDRAVLLILLVPLLAIILVILGNHNPEGKETRLQYDPVRIAARGLILPQDRSRSLDGIDDHWKVWASAKSNGVEFMVGEEEVRAQRK